MNENAIDDEESRFYDGECQGCDMLVLAISSMPAG
jgi:hypothetical protein